MAWPVTCTKCDENLSAVPEGERCPACGDTRRTTHISVHDSASATDAISRLGMAYAPDRPWQEQWAAVLNGLEELRKAYAGRTDGPRDTNRWRQIPIEFCEDAYHLKDWVKNDPLVPLAVRDGVKTFVRSSTAIRLVGDLANTHKHRTRDGGGTAARIAFVDLQPGSSTKATFRIEWTRPDGKTGTEDALDVAEAAVAEWRAFFAANGLSEA